MRRGDGRAHGSMTVREREREHRPKHDPRIEDRRLADQRARRAGEV
jgi:hypothetical protein